jgi:hypothetical protein
MNFVCRCLLLYALFFGRSVLAGEQIAVKTREGQLISGQLVSETDRGFLIDVGTESRLIEYGNVVEVLRQSPVSAKTELKRSSETLSSGLSLGVGGGLFAHPPLGEARKNYSAFGVAARFVIDYDFERIGFRAAPGLGFGVFSRDGKDYASSFGLATLGLEMRIHFGIRVSSGVGALLGLGLASVPAISGTPAATFIAPYGVVGPALSLVSVRLGDSRQHEIETTVALLFSSTSTTGIFQVNLGYVYHFTR